MHLKKKKEQEVALNRPDLDWKYSKRTWIGSILWKVGNSYNDFGVESGMAGFTNKEVDYNRINEGPIGKNVLKELLEELGKGSHIVTTNNYFKSMHVFLDL